MFGRKLYITDAGCPFSMIAAGFDGVPSVGHDNFDLIARANTAFINEFTADFIQSVGCNIAVKYKLIFRKGFGRIKSTGQVKLAKFKKPISSCWAAGG